jgi:hypothetical protein
MGGPGGAIEAAGGRNAGLRRGFARSPILAGPLGRGILAGMDTPEKRR